MGLINVFDRWILVLSYDVDLACFRLCGSPGLSSGFIGPYGYSVVCKASWTWDSLKIQFFFILFCELGSGLWVLSRSGHLFLTCLRALEDYWQSWRPPASSIQGSSQVSPDSFLLFLVFQLFLLHPHPMA